MYSIRILTIIAITVKTTIRILEMIKESSDEEYKLYMPIDEWSRYSFRDNPAFIGHKENEESQEKLNEVWKAIYEYEMCTMRRERKILLKMLGR